MLKSKIIVLEVKNEELEEEQDLFNNQKKSRIKYSNL